MWRIQSRWMKLVKFHILYLPFGTIHHSNAIASSNNRIGCGAVYIACTTCCYQYCLGNNGIYLLCFRIISIHAIALNILHSVGYQLTQMVLRNNIYGKMMGNNFYVWMCMHLLQQGTFNLFACNIFMVQYAIFRMAAFFA